MITYGFFNSVDGDRTYNAESFNDFFEGLISANGIFETIGSRFSVTAGTGLSVNVGDGRARVNSRWVKSDAVETVALDVAHALLSRYDAIVLRWDGMNRQIVLDKLVGTSASTPQKPTPTRNATTYEIVLAYVLVSPGATTLTAANIEDCRYNTELCGVITGLVDQVDTSTLYEQYATSFSEMQSQMLAWQEQQMAQFTSWFDTLTESLRVDTYVDRVSANVQITEARVNYIDMPETLEYKSSDILDVFVNGVLLVENLDYEVRTNEVENIPMIYIFNELDANATVTFYCTKSKIGFTSAVAGEAIAGQAIAGTT